MTNLKRIIDEKGVRQRWLAEQVGVTEVSMSRYVSGERIPKAPIAIRMADVLGVDVKDLYEWESEKRTEERTETHACDLIERQAAIDALISHITPRNNGDGSVTIGVLSKSSIKNILDGLPSAQPDIIRCKDCKHFAGEGMYCSCDIIVQFDHFYCYHAERRQDV